MDGRKSLFKLWESYNVQMCHDHMRKSVERYLTKNPKLLASRELLTIVRGLHTASREEFEQSFAAWQVKWRETIQRRSLHKSGKRPYRHRRIRSAMYSISAYLPHLFTFQSPQCLGMPNTNNKIEGTFTALKSKQNCHHGMSSASRKRLVSGFFLALKAKHCISTRKEPPPKG